MLAERAGGRADERRRRRHQRPLDGRLVLLGVTGSIAAYKAAELVRLLTAAGAEVQVLMTHTASDVHRAADARDAQPPPR